MASKRFKIIKTVALIFAWICMGLFSEVSSPTLPYLKKRVDANYEEISRALVARSVGFLLGSLGAGVVGSRWRRLNDFWIALSLFLAGGATIAAPWCPSLMVLAALFFLDGAGKGLLAVVTSTSVMILWKDKAAVPTHSLHFSYGIGALLAPQISRPFLPQEEHSTSNAINGNKTVTSPTTNLTTDITAAINGTGTSHHEVGSSDQIEFAYAITGGITILIGLVFLYFQLAHKNSDDEGSEMVKKRTDDGGSTCEKLGKAVKSIRPPVLIFLMILFVFWCLPTGAERSYGKFLFAYAVESSKLPPATAASLETVFWACFTSGRGIATIVSTFVQPSVLLAGEIIVKLISASMLAFLAKSNTTILFVASGILGATISPIFPASMVWTNLYIKMNAAMNAFAFLSAAFGAFIFSWGTGYLFQFKGPQYLMYLMLGYAGATLVVYLIFFFYLRCGKVKRREDLKSKQDDQELDEMNEKVSVKL